MADNTRGLTTTKQTKPRPIASVAPHPITPAYKNWKILYKKCPNQLCCHTCPTLAELWQTDLPKLVCCVKPKILPWSHSTRGRWERLYYILSYMYVIIIVTLQSKPDPRIDHLNHRTHSNLNHGTHSNLNHGTNTTLIPPPPIKEINPNPLPLPLAHRCRQSRGLHLGTSKKSGLFLLQYSEQWGSVSIEIMIMKSQRNQQVVHTKRVGIKRNGNFFLRIQVSSFTRMITLIGPPPPPAH